MPSSIVPPTCRLPSATGQCTKHARATNSCTGPDPRLLGARLYLHRAAHLYVEQRAQARCRGFAAAPLHMAAYGQAMQAAQ